MTIDNVFLILWLVFIGYWAVSAIGIKRDVHREWPHARSRGMRIVILLALLAIWLAPYDRVRSPSTESGPALAYIGVVLCAAGIGFAIWARWHLGRNWSPTPSLKADHDLITTGPYRLVRHPIYTGIFFAMLGTALAGGLRWYVTLVLFSLFLVRRVQLEERLMMQQFPDAYPEYRRQTKAVIPFLL